jgi:type III pantothenate kinase
MHLVLDIGNTRTKLGLFQENLLVEQANWIHWSFNDLLAYGQAAGVDRLLICSVATPDPDLILQISDAFQIVELTHLTPLPFQNQYTTPQTLGKDRLAGVAGAQALFPSENCLVIDCGTCIKYDFIDQNNIYHGGNIAPGAQMRIQAMHHFTARLPEVPMQLPDQFIGFNTESALQNGALRGAQLEIEGFMRLFAKKTGPLRSIITGGDAPFFLQALQNNDLIHEPNLTLIGLNAILTFQS